MATQADFDTTTATPVAIPDNGRRLLVVGLASLGLELFQAQHRGARPLGRRR